MTASISHHEEAFGLNVLSSVRELQQRGLWCDAKITCADGTSLFVHRILLSAVSPYFRDKFAQQCDDISVPFTSDVMRQLVKYCYSGEISITTKSSLDVYLAASRFKLNALHTTAERHLFNNLESVIQSERFRLLDYEALEQLLDHLPLSLSRQSSVLLRSLMNWLQYDQTGRLAQFAAIMTKLGEKYHQKTYYNLMLAPYKIKQAVSPGEQAVVCRTRYILLQDRIYKCDENTVSEIQWKELLAEKAQPDCVLVLPLSSQSGQFLSGHQRPNRQIRLYRHWNGGKIAQGDVRSVSLNQRYAVDSQNTIRSLRVDCDRPLMADMGRKVPECFSDVYNISADDNNRLLLYGSVEGRKTLAYADAEVELRFDAPEKVSKALDVVHIPGTQVIYQVWSGHIEEMHITADRSIPRWPTQVIFLPKDTQVSRVLHPFCDKVGIVILVQDVWSARHSVLRYSKGQWEILLQLDGHGLSFS